VFFPKLSFVGLALIAGHLTDKEAIAFLKIKASFRLLSFIAIHLLEKIFRAYVYLERY